MRVGIEIKEAFKEIGKSLLAFGNIIVGVVFLKHFWEYSDYRSLVVGISLWLGLYAISFSLISFSAKMEAE